MDKEKTFFQFFFLVGKDPGNVNKGIWIGKDEGKIALLCRQQNTAVCHEHLEIYPSVSPPPARLCITQNFICCGSRYGAEFVALSSTKRLNINLPFLSYFSEV